MCWNCGESGNVLIDEKKTVSSFSKYHFTVRVEIEGTFELGLTAIIIEIIN
ncbi:hypothetical protein ACSVC9_02735 [Clostridium sp. LBM24168]